MLLKVMGTCGSESLTRHVLSKLWGDVLCIRQVQLVTTGTISIPKVNLGREVLQTKGIYSTVSLLNNSRTLTKNNSPESHGGSSIWCWH